MHVARYPAISSPSRYLFVTIPLPLTFSFRLSRYLHIVTMASTDYAHPQYETITLTQQPLPTSAPSSIPPQAVTVISLNRPSRLNAFTIQMALELESAFTILSADPSVRVIVLTGTGRAFCAGADLTSSTLSLADIRPEDHRDEGGRVSLSIYRCTKPVIAAINGPAVGVLSLPNFLSFFSH